MKRVLGIAGWSGSGKTTLLRALIPVLSGRGVTVSTIKHAHHDFDIDRPGKDSYLHRTAGAQEVMISSAHRFALMHELRGAELIMTSSAHRFALMHELRGAPEPTLQDLVERLAPVDIVLVEGFKFDPVPKLEVHRPALGKPPIWPDDPHIVAVATDAPLADCARPTFNLNDVASIASMVVESAIGLEAAQ